MMPTKEEIQKSFREFLTSCDVEDRRTIWQKQSHRFRQFWQDKILNDSISEVPETELDPIIRILDYKAKGSRDFREAGGKAVALTFIWQGTWYRLFNDLKNKKDIRQILDDIFHSSDDQEIIRLIDDLNVANEKNKNGLTGKSGNALNALLFAFSPNLYICMVSLNHRMRIIEFFGLDDIKAYESYSFGEKIIKTNNAIISGFREKYGISTTHRVLTQFIYSIRFMWKKISDDSELSEEKSDLESAEDKELIRSGTDSNFAIETHLEDFLIANWEKTDLGRSFELIEEDGNLISQQYSTGVGRIDILVRDKNNNEYVVIELKKGRGSDRVVGQVLRYIGWIKEHKTKNGGRVRGLIITREDDEKLNYALKTLPDIDLYLYKIDFSLEKKNI